MTTTLFVAGVLLLCLPGGVFARSRALANAGVAARLAISFAAGTLITTLLMYAMSLLHLPWSRTVCGCVLIVISVVGIAVKRRSENRECASPTAEH